MILRMATKRRGAAPPLALLYRFSADLDDLAGFQAARAHPHPLHLALHQPAQRHQIGQPAALRHVVRVADLVADGRTFASDIPALSHAGPRAFRGVPVEATFYSMLRHRIEAAPG